MKRYEIDNADAEDFPYRAGMSKHPNGRWLNASEVQSHARTLLAVVDRMEHGLTCDTNICAACARLRQRPDFEDELAFLQANLHDHEPGQCSCALSELRRGLEVMING